MLKKCRHCGHKIGKGARRGLCWACYRNPGVRARYARLPAGPKPDVGREPDATELEQRIAAQLKRLPAWWDAECERIRTEEYRPKVYQLVKCS